MENESPAMIARACACHTKTIQATLHAHGLQSQAAHGFTAIISDSQVHQRQPAPSKTIAGDCGKEAQLGAEEAVDSPGQTPVELDLYLPATSGLVCPSHQSREVLAQALVRGAVGLEEHPLVGTSQRAQDEG